MPSEMDKRVRCVDAKPDPYMESWRFQHRKETGTEVPVDTIISPSLTDAIEKCHPSCPLQGLRDGALRNITILHFKLYYSYSIHMIVIGFDGSLVIPKLFTASIVQL
jgi:hypothetical protein